MILFAAILAALMGLVLGMLGGGGSVLAVPILLYVVGLGAKEAIATSLLIVGATSIVVAAQHWRAGNVRPKVAVAFGVFAMGGAYLGGIAAQWVPGTLLLLMFAGLMIAAGIAMLVRRTAAEPTAKPSLAVAAIEGLVVGALTGLVGAGGGFLIVPALVLVAGLDMRSAVGTSSLIIAMKSFAAFAGHATHVTVDFELAALLTAVAVVGSVAGAQLANRIEPGRLRRGFGVFVLLMATMILAIETQTLWALPVIVAVIGALLFFLRYRTPQETH